MNKKLKIILVVFYFVIIILPVHSQLIHGAEIEIQYIYSFDPFYDINIYFYNYDSENAFIEVSKRQIENENDKLFWTIKINEDYFYYIYNKIINLNMKEMLLNNSKREYVNENFVSIRIGTYNCFQTFSIINPKIDAQERKLEKINLILMEIFEKINISKYYK
jgi:hypothetical protein